MATGVVPGLQSRCGASRRPGWVRFPHVPAIFAFRRWPGLALLALTPVVAGGGLVAQAPDSARVAPGGGAERGPAILQETAPDTLPPVSPLGALARSIVLPGWGQTAVDRPARGAVYFTLEVASLFMVFKSQSELSAARRAEPRDEELVESRRATREDWIVLAAFWAFASGLDAWVSTHFWDFEAEVEPPEEAGVGVALRVRLPVGPP